MEADVIQGTKGEDGAEQLCHASGAGATMLKQGD